MKNTGQVHEETVAMITEAVADLTERAVRPALVPFQQEMRKLTGALKDEIDEFKAAVDDSRKESARLRTAVGQNGTVLGERLTGIDERLDALNRDLQSLRTTLTEQRTAGARDVSKLRSALLTGLTVVGILALVGAAFSVMLLMA